MYFFVQIFFINFFIFRTRRSRNLSHGIFKYFYLSVYIILFCKYLYQKCTRQHNQTVNRYIRAQTITVHGQLTASAPFNTNFPAVFKSQKLKNKNKMASPCRDVVHRCLRKTKLNQELKMNQKVRFRCLSTFATFLKIMEKVQIPRPFPLDPACKL